MNRVTNNSNLTGQYQSDIESILAKRYDNGADLWATPDKRIYKGAPFSTLESLLMLTELEPAPTPVMLDSADLLLSLWRDDGRFQIMPKSAIYPCQTVRALSLWDRSIIHEG